jgi:hypothetical protein
MLPMLMHFMFLLMKRNLKFETGNWKNKDYGFKITECPSKYQFSSFKP